LATMVNGRNYKCDDGWEGIACDLKICGKNCSGQGICLNGTCACNKGFMGDICQAVKCKNGCSGNGNCINGECSCKNGFDGDDCSSLFVVNGEKFGNGSIICWPGWTG